MLMRGADPRYVQQQLGHESLSTTYRYYAHWIPKDARASYANLIELTPSGESEGQNAGKRTGGSQRVIR
jgi:hypothetical protein